MIVGLICAALIDEMVPFLVVLAIVMLGLFAIKGYYLILRIKDWIEERKRR